MGRLFSLALPLSMLLSACGTATRQPTNPQTTIPEVRALTVFAAASLTDAFTEIGKSFESANPAVSVTFNFAGSQALRTQAEEGAAADVFASASRTEMDILVAGAFVTQEAPQVFLTNKLVVILPADNSATLEKLEDLANSGIKLVLAAEEVPVGNYARQALDQMNGQFGSDFKKKVLANVVSNEDNVRQVVAKVQLGEADAGIVYSSDAIAAPELKTIEIPDELNLIAEYPIAPLANSANPDLARLFVNFVMSAPSQAILQKWGFGPAE
jgi:molybdate transport system substrate-binding protein